MGTADATFGAAREAVQALVARLRRTDGTVPGWRLPFELARVLKGLPGDDPLGWEPLALEFFAEMGLNPAEEFGAFVTAWDKVNCPGGQDAWDLAARLAEDGPAAMESSPGTTYAPLARTCYHLSVMAKGRPFPVPVARVAELLGVSTQAASQAIRALVRAGVLECTDPAFSYVEGKAKEYRLLAHVVRRGVIPDSRVLEFDGS